MDIVGPFDASHIHGYRWILVIVDDHSRFKMIKVLKKKSDALEKANEFLASLKSMASRRDGPISIVGNVKCDNAGEFLSREFKAMLAGVGTHQTTCPPHVHQLNGVAERAIRSIMEQIRVNLVASNFPISFWAYAAQHGVDVLNRTTGPPDNDLTSFEVMHGEQPKVMGLLPFGCRAHVVRPKDFIRKSTIDAHAWPGANLGRSSSSPGAYNVWVPSTGRVHTSSDVYFTERLFPHRAPHDQFVGPDLPAAPAVDASQPPGIATLPPPAAPSPPSGSPWEDSVRSSIHALVDSAADPPDHPAGAPPADPPSDHNAPLPPPPPPTGRYSPRLATLRETAETATFVTAADVTATPPPPPTAPPPPSPASPPATTWTPPASPPAAARTPPPAATAAAPPTVAPTTAAPPSLQPSRYNPSGRAPPATRSRAAHGLFAAGIDEDAVSRDVPSSVGSGQAFFASGAGRALYDVSAAAGAVGSAQLASADPVNRKAAMLDDAEGWRAAERKEIANHIENSTLTPIPLSQVPRGRRPGSSA